MQQYDVNKSASQQQNWLWMLILAQTLIRDCFATFIIVTKHVFNVSFNKNMVRMQSYIKIISLKLLFICLNFIFF